MGGGLGYEEYKWNYILRMGEPRENTGSLHTVFVPIFALRSNPLPKKSTDGKTTRCNRVSHVKIDNPIILLR